MSYLFPEGSALEEGVLQVGANINVLNGVISIPQSVDPTAFITFANITDTALTQGRVTFAGTGGLLTDDGDLTYDPTTNTLSVVNVNVTNNLSLNGANVITSVTPTAGPGISLTSVTTSGPAAAFTVNNTGVLSLTAGTGIALSGPTGNVTISSTGTSVVNTKGVGVNYTLLSTDDYVGATVNGITLTLPAGVTGQSYIIKNETSTPGSITIAKTGADTIDGATTKTLNNSASITVVFRAGAWRIV